MSNHELLAFLSEIRAVREQTLSELVDLTEEDFATPTDMVRWDDVRRVLLRFGDHMREHSNQLEGARYAIDRGPNFFSVCDCDGFVQRGLGAWQVALRYSYADFSSLDIDGGQGSATTLGMNWHWNPYARMQFNYIFGNIASQTTVDGDYQIFGVRFMVDF